eukprot:scaffold3909_cov117-Isochrysis_galbana.AAC.6
MPSATPRRRVRQNRSPRAIQAESQTDTRATAGGARFRSPTPPLFRPPPSLFTDSPPLAPRALRLPALSAPPATTASNSS